MQQVYDLEQRVQDVLLMLLFFSLPVSFFIRHKIHEEIRFVYINMQVLSSLKGSWQRLIHHPLAHRFHHVSF